VLSHTHFTGIIRSCGKASSRVASCRHVLFLTASAPQQPEQYLVTPLVSWVRIPIPHPFNPFGLDVDAFNIGQA